MRLEPGRCQYQHQRQEAHRRLVWLLIQERTQEQATEDGDWLSPEGSTLNKRKWAVEPPGKANARSQVQVPPQLQEKFVFDVALEGGSRTRASHRACEASLAAMVVIHK